MAGTEASRVRLSFPIFKEKSKGMSVSMSTYFTLVGGYYEYTSQTGTIERTSVKVDSGRRSWPFRDGIAAGVMAVRT